MFGVLGSVTYCSPHSNINNDGYPDLMILTADFWGSACQPCANQFLVPKQSVAKKPLSAKRRSFSKISLGTEQLDQLPGQPLNAAFIDLDEDASLISESAYPIQFAVGNPGYNDHDADKRRHSQDRDLVQ
jgi:hypothetical protein